MHYTFRAAELALADGSWTANDDHARSILKGLAEPLQALGYKSAGGLRPGQFSSEKQPSGLLFRVNQDVLSISAAATPPNWKQVARALCKYAKDNGLKLGIDEQSLRYLPRGEMKYGSQMAYPESYSNYANTNGSYVPVVL